ncbi:E3 ubiquitin-protein ligase RBBP6 protein [Dioscorea alata]|uniref:E3 ubiquitin-protein ligase RBBP6 protein n=3 Tax=Dioscorea alata TaxID=55571 RepID=A0ACB7TYJ7_DIOAL|nr:E3 ubiquitin-protein ligase RBBP6 protein [Dioscorea alata]KAH7653126.1 E3 ubiquitin-protein ligase RBBP6 protein [Dioscorea alata]KAH7653128.1 E3 ubiquitin-protein ligase RBBP6 protein [Dioscorea alata]
MAVYYKFKSAKDYDSVPIEGQFISLANLKERIFESKHLGRGTDFDLMVANAQTNEEYVDEAAMIPKNTSVLIRRVPGRPRKPIVTEPDEQKVVEDKVEDIPPPTSNAIGESSTTKYPEESEWDEFGTDLYAIPDVTPFQSVNPVMDIAPANKIDEDSKIKALIDTPALDWNRQGNDAYGAGRGFGRGMGGRMMPGRGFGRGGGLERRTPPAGYVCHRCKVPGHFIQHCPTNGDPNYDIKRVKPPTGIPKSMLMATPDGSYALPSGAVAVLRPNEAAFEKEIEGLPSTRPVSDLPPELRCPLCKEVMKDAVLTSKCCFSSFCDKCIRDYIITKSMCVCGATNILADDLLPNKTLRETINRIMEATTSSTENVGSLIQVQDMESARPVLPKAPSPTTLSVASKDEQKPVPVEQSVDIKEAEIANDTKPVIAEKNAVKSTDPSVATPESASVKELTSQESAPVQEELQEKLSAADQGKKKKKKKTRPLGSAGTGADMQWRSYQDLGAESYASMPMAPSAYNPYWVGGMPMGMDGYMAPYAGTMPYMGYAPGPFDVPFGGMLPQDPFAAQGYMLPVGPQRDLSELGMAGVGMNQGPLMMSREEFEARKADFRRKREMERVSEREHSRDKGNIREGHSNSADIPPMKSKPQRRPSQGTGVDRADYPVDRYEKSTAPPPDRHAPPASRERDSPHRPEKRRTATTNTTSTTKHDPISDPAGADRKQKGSVFSRISFPGSGGGGSAGGGSGSSGDKKRKSSETPNGLKEHEPSHRSGSNGYRDDRTGSRRGGGATSAAAAAGGYDGESSEEEYHFKRRPSRRDADHEDDGRGSRSSRDRDRDRDNHKRR